MRRTSRALPHTGGDAIPEAEDGIGRPDDGRTLPRIDRGEIGERDDGRRRRLDRDHVGAEPADGFQLPSRAVAEDPGLGPPPLQAVRGHLFGHRCRREGRTIEDAFHRGTLGVPEQPYVRRQHTSSVPEPERGRSIQCGARLTF